MRKIISLLAILVVMGSCIGIGLLINLQKEVNTAMISAPPPAVVDLAIGKLIMRDLQDMKMSKVIRVIPNIKYGEDERQALDVYMPPNANGAPVIFFVHGGGWSEGHRETYGSIGHFYAQKGYVVVLVDHRLSPKVAHPAHVEDVALALKWTKENIQEYGGFPFGVSLFGHSSGAHLVSLLATNQKYLTKVGMSKLEIRKVVAVSGIYNLGTNLDIAGFGKVFSKSSERYEASPINFVTPYTPKFLVIHAENDIITLAYQARKFDAALKGKGASSHLHKASKKDHTTVLLSCVSSGETSDIVLDFLKSR
jgi:acetyl esterase/lipase